MQLKTIYIGSNKVWLLVMIAFVIMSVFSPAIEAGLWHLHHRDLITCGSFTIKIPLFWMGTENIDSISACQQGFSIHNLGATLIGSPDAGSSLDIIPTLEHSKGDRSSIVEGQFRKLHANAGFNAYALNPDFSHCLISDDPSQSKRMIGLICEAKNQNLSLIFSGTRHGLSTIKGSLSH